MKEIPVDCRDEQSMGSQALSTRPPSPTLPSVPLQPLEIVAARLQDPAAVGPATGGCGGRAVAPRRERSCKWFPGEWGRENTAPGREWIFFKVLFIVVKTF